MKNKRGVIRIISKATTITLLSTAICIVPIKNDVYALPNQTTVNQSKNKIEIGKIKSCDYLNLRKGPSTKYSLIEKIYKNESVEIIEKSSSGWYKVKTKKGKVGWASGKYIEIQIENNKDDDKIQNTSDKTKKILDVANKQKGKPYSWGASGPKAFDCSGFTSYVYKNAVGVKLPRTSKQQATVGKKVSKSKLKKGDLVFFSTSGKGISHVGIYIGDSKFIHSPSSGKTVKIDNLNSSYYSRTFVTGRAII